MERMAFFAYAVCPKKPRARPPPQLRREGPLSRLAPGPGLFGPPALETAVLGANGAPAYATSGRAATAAMPRKP